MAKRKIERKESYNQTPVSAFSQAIVNSLCASSFSTKEEYAKLTAALPIADKALIVHPLGVGEWIMSNANALFEKVFQNAPTKVELACSHPSDEQTSLKTIYNLPSQNSAKERQGNATLFDKLKKENKKTLLLVPKRSGLDILFASLPVDVVATDHDADAVNKTLNALKKEDYSLIIVILGDYQDMLEVCSPLSKTALKVCEKQADMFSILCDACQVYWSQSQSIVGFCPPNSCHKGLFRGKVGGDKTDDMNLTWSFAYQPVSVQY